MSNKAKVRLFVARDLISILLFLQILVAALGAVVFAIDQATGYNILKEISGGNAEVGVYYLCGLIALLALLGLSTLLGVCCCSSNVCQSDDDDADLMCCAYCYCCWWGYPCYPMWYWSPLYYPHGAACCGAPGVGHCFCMGGGCSGGCHGGGDGRVTLILLLVVLAILALIGLFVMVYVLAIVGQRLFQRHVEILARQEACRQQEIVDLSKIEMSQIGNYAVVDLEPSAPEEPNQGPPSQVAPAPSEVAPSAPPKDTIEDSEPLWEAGGRDDEPLLNVVANP